MVCRALVAIWVWRLSRAPACGEQVLMLFRARGRKTVPRCVRAACHECKVPTAAARRMRPAVELAGPGQPLVVRNIGQEMREDEVAALQRRAVGR